MNCGGLDGSNLASLAKAEEIKTTEGPTGGSLSSEGTPNRNQLYSSLIQGVSPASGPRFSGGLSQDATACLEASKAYIAPRESTDNVKLAARGSSSEEAKIATMSFPQVLFEILAKEEHPDIISWLPHGLGFRIKNKKRFAAEVMPRYFRQSKFTSFTRKLNRWNFTRVTRGPETGSYYHPYFKCGDLSLCMQMKCCKTAAMVPNDGSNPLVSTPSAHNELRTMQQLEQRRIELLIRKHQEQQLASSVAALLRTGRPAADATTLALAAATTQSNNTSPYLAMLLGQHHAQINPMEDSRRHQAAMFLQQQQIVPYAQQQQMIPFAQQQLAAAAQQQQQQQQQQESRWADEAKEIAQHQERK